MKRWVVDILINQVLAWLSRWLDMNAPTQQKHDPKPAPIVKPKKPDTPKRNPKYHGIPGFDRDTGTWS